MSSVICNASPLIILAKAQMVDLLPRLFSEIFVPQAVVAEIEAGPGDDPMSKALPRCGWLNRVVLDPPLSPLSAWQLGRGEAEVIEYARLHSKLPALLDDRAARRAAISLGIPVYGTLSVVGMFAARGLVKSFPEAVAQVQAAGLYASEHVIAQVTKALQKPGS